VGEYKREIRRMTNNDFLKLLEELQHKIEYEEKQKYSKVVIHEYKNPSNFGVLDDYDAIGEIKGPCGDKMKISLEIKNERIINSNFWTDGCGATIACGSMLTKMIKGKFLREIKNISSLTLMEALNGLPIEHHHCTVLAINTLNNAINNYKK
jgi:nitrogen fixation NifU-like protein